MRSRVIPGSLVTIDRRVPVRRLKIVDLPTLGRPTITTDGSFSVIVSGGVQVEPAPVKTQRTRSERLGGFYSILLFTETEGFTPNIAGRYILRQRGSMSPTKVIDDGIPANFDFRHEWHQLPGR